MKIPAVPPIQLHATGRRFELEKPLKRQGQTQLHHFTSQGMVIFSTESCPHVISAIIMVIS